jgi:hypothetical protein
MTAPENELWLFRALDFQDPVVARDLHFGLRNRAGQQNFFAVLLLSSLGGNGQDIVFQVNLDVVFPDAG